MIRVLVVDDSAIVRQMLKVKLSEIPEIEVVGIAPDAFVARDKIISLKPDVMTLDIEMPRMDGVEFLRRLMPQWPMPVIVLSSLTKTGGEVTLSALEAGAFDFVTKPSGQLGVGVVGVIQDLSLKIIAAHNSNYQIVNSIRKMTGVKAKAPILKSKNTLKNSTQKVIVVGASTGGTEAFRAIVESLPSDIPGMVVVQHFPPGVSGNFAKRLNSLSKLEIKEAENGERILPGFVYIAPGGMHTEVLRWGGNYTLLIKKGNYVNNHMPSIDILFASVAKNVGKNAIGVLLTGMGKDGAKSMLEMRNAGSENIVQDEASSIVWGMPGEAWEIGAAQKKVNLEKIPETLMYLIEKNRIE
jgi:two-component system, chemotaxis family, protein-glutamate methylesterase/glutaminase